MWHSSVRLTPGPLAGSVSPGRLAQVTSPPRAAEATNYRSTRTFDARPEFAARTSIFERACRTALKAAARAWSDIDDHAHVDRRAPPGRDPSGRDQGKPDRRI